MIVSGNYEGCVRTGIRIPGYRQGNSAQRMSRLMADTGYVVRGNAVEEWKVESSVDEPDGDGAPKDGTLKDAGPVSPGGATILSGRFFTGESLDETIAACAADAHSLSGSHAQPGGPVPEPRRRAESAISCLAGAFATLSDQGKLPRELASCGIMTGTDSALILPPKIVQLAMAKLAPGDWPGMTAFLRSGATRDAGSEAAFLLAQAAYRLACGVPAWEAQPGSGLPAFARGGFVPSALVQPRLKPALAARIDSSLASPAAADLPAWVRALSDCGSDGWLVDIDAAQAETAGRLRATSEERLRRENRRADFLRKRGGILLAAGVTLAVLGVVVGSVISDRGKRPDFSALDPVALAKTYYKGVDTLDGVLLEVTADRSAYKADDSMVSSMTVLTKMRMAYEQKSPMLAAADWLAKGKPPLESGVIVYGITGLDIQPAPAGGAVGVNGGGGTGGTGGGSAPEAQSGDTVRLQASYTLWTMGAGREGVAPQPESRDTVDELTLKRINKGRNGVVGWKIVKLERGEPGPDGTAPAP